MYIQAMRNNCKYTYFWSTYIIEKNELNYRKYPIQYYIHIVYERVCFSAVLQYLVYKNCILKMYSFYQNDSDLLLIILCSLNFSCLYLHHLRPPIIWQIRFFFLFVKKTIRMIEIY